MEPLSTSPLPGPSPLRRRVRRPRVTPFRALVAATALVVAVIGWSMWSGRPVVVPTPGTDFTAWVDDRAVAMTMTACTTTAGCEAPVLVVDAGERVRLGFRASSPLTLVTDSTAVRAAIDENGWFLDTTAMTGRTLVGVVGGDANMWQVIVKVRA